MSPDVKPHEIDRADYRAHVDLCAEVALDAMDEDEAMDVHEAVRYATEGDSWVIHHGYTFAVVYWSDCDPDAPDYSERWSAYADLDDPTATDCLMAMAIVCLIDDVTAEVRDRLDEGAD